MNNAIAKRIAAFRKNNSKTQQQLADFLGVTKASVSKWETGQTYPDISLLPLLAAYFDTTIDYLLGYDAHLTLQDIQRLYASIQKEIIASPSDGLNHLRKLVKHYWSCDTLVFSMASLMMNQLTLLTQDDPQQQPLLLQEISDLLNHVYDNTADSELKQQIKIMLSTLLLNQGKAAEVLELVGKTVPPLVPPESIIAIAYHLLGDAEQADATFQAALYQYLTVILSLFSNYLIALDNDYSQFQETVDKADGFVALFEIAEFHPVIVLNLYLAEAVGYATYQQNTLAITMLEKFANLFVKTTFPLKLKGNHYFDKVDPWIEQLMLGGQMPRDTTLMQADLQQAVKNHPAFEGLKAEAAYQKIIKLIESHGE
ncbi:transcriptional regulator with XRE-family HTH domain [Enterococcus sp. PF1-24]|uniref:helix-turn-helix domain-containing protein n=1 Tax=unclassified Enterococcus TaxID=2608891 RepID=UPI0024772BD7|nr:MULTISPECIES: helix-turn-helix transcriptional regulator [unclassified Enterococcus]MDH6365697.1 transcriptional regulator with XRE-family HTH domain [Enterococcus sp. PFB1-1]MDH6402803.1 transcriptional regulator with XRE-family HTH domain [Enterococcus sp. PF1-24]